MKVLKCFLSFLVAVAFMACSRNLAPAGHYQATPVIADGNANDWPLPLRFANKDYSYNYNITNDKKNIYIILLSKDENKIHQILKSGVTIYFDPKGETNKNISLTFPEKKADNITQSGTLIRYNTNDSLNSTKVLASQSDTYTAQGFFGLENGRYSITNKKNKMQIGLKINADSGLVYEAVIPVNYVLEYGLTDKSLKKNFTIGIVVHNDVATERRNNNANANNRNGGSGIQPRVSIGAGLGGFGIGGARMGMGMGGGGMRSGRNTNNQQPTKPAEEEIVWYQFRFTTQAN
jgi:hypothetical protein